MTVESTSKHTASACFNAVIAASTLVPSRETMVGTCVSDGGVVEMEDVLE